MACKCGIKIIFATHHFNLLRLSICWSSVNDTMTNWSRTNNEFNSGDFILFSWISSSLSVRHRGTFSFFQYIFFHLNLQNYVSKLHFHSSAVSLFLHINYFFLYFDVFFCKMFIDRIDATSYPKRARGWWVREEGGEKNIYIFK